MAIKVIITHFFDKKILKIFRLIPIFLAIIVSAEANMTASFNERKVLENEFVTVDLLGQFGNQLFQIATAYAYSLDQNIPLSIPNLFTEKKWNIDRNAQRLFVDRIKATPLSRPLIKWQEPDLGYTPIPVTSKIRLTGYFQSEKYFKHRREEILNLFSPPTDLTKKILDKYPILSTNALVVGVQIRDYRHEFPTGAYHGTHGRSYYEKAIQYFPSDSIFIVSTNNSSFAKDCMQRIDRNIIYLESGDYIEDFFTLILCKSFIISNSSFGWFAAWLSTGEDKRVIVPIPWLAPPYNDTQGSIDRFPIDWILIKD
jgi:hypothetical protein